MPSEANTLRTEVIRLLSELFISGPSPERLADESFAMAPHDPRDLLETTGPAADVAAQWVRLLWDYQCIDGHAPLHRALSTGYRRRRAPEVMGFASFGALLTELDAPCRGVRPGLAGRGSAVSKFGYGVGGVLALLAVGGALWFLPPDLLRPDASAPSAAPSDPEPRVERPPALAHPVDAAPTYGPAPINERALKKEAELLLAPRVAGDAALNRVLLEQTFRGVTNDPRASLRTDGAPRTLATSWVETLWNARCIEDHSPLYLLLKQAYVDQRDPAVQGLDSFDALLGALDAPCIGGAGSAAGVVGAGPITLAVNDLVSAGADVRIQFQRETADGDFVPLAASAGEAPVMRSGDSYRLSVSAVREIYLYIVHFDAWGQVRELLQLDRDGDFPRSQERNLLRPGESIQLPGPQRYGPGTKYQLDDKTGQEHFHFVLSLTPVPGLVAEYQSGHRGGEALSARGAKVALQPIAISTRGGVPTQQAGYAGEYQGGSGAQTGGAGAESELFRCRLGANGCQTEFAIDHRPPAGD